MAKKDFLLEMGDRSDNPEDADVLLKSKISERKRKEIARQEEEDEATHKAKMAELAKKTATSEAAVDKTGDKKETESPFKFDVKGGIDIGHIDLQAERTQAIQDLKDLKKEQEEAVRSLGQENQQLRDKIHEQEMKVIATSFESALATVKEKLESKGTIAEQIAGIRAMAKELGMTQPEPGVGDPALQIQMLQLQHAEAQRDREFQWQMQKDKEAREDQKERHKDEMAIKQQEAARLTKRDEMFVGAPEMLGRAIAQGLMVGKEGGGEVSAIPRGKQRYELDVPVGKEGETECPECQTKVGIGPTAKSAICSKCNTKIFIKRVEAPVEEPTEEEEE